MLTARGAGMGLGVLRFTCHTTPRTNGPDKYCIRTGLRCRAGAREGLAGSVGPCWALSRYLCAVLSSSGSQCQGFLSYSSLSDCPILSSASKAPWLFNFSWSTMVESQEIRQKANQTKTKNTKKYIPQK